MIKESLFGKSLGEIVSGDFRAATVFKEAGLDFCCGGKKSLREACIEKNIDAEDIAKSLSELKNSARPRGLNFSEWSPAFLADYIENVHHTFVLKALPDLVSYTRKIAEVHGERHTELYQVADLMSDINKELIQHLGKQEEILFPAIRNMLNKKSEKEKPLIKAVLKRMTAEHEYAGSAMDKINVLTKGYLIPGDGCNTYALTMKLLSEFEDDLHIHVHLENNILYPAAQRMAEN